MNKQVYTSPEVEKMDIRLEERILDGSVNATRQSYGDAETDTWD